MILSLDVQRNKTLMTQTHVIVDTANKGITQQFQISDGTPLYDLTDCTLEFRVPSREGVVTGTTNKIDDPKKGLFTATWPQALYDHSLDSLQGVFLIKKSDTVIDTTSRFWVTVQPTAGIIETIGKSAVDGVAESMGYIAQAVTDAQSAVKDAENVASGVSKDVTDKINALGANAIDATAKATNAATSANTAADAATKAAGTVDTATKAATDAATDATTAAGKATDAATGATNATKAATDATTAANTAAGKADASAAAADKIVTNAGDIADMETKTDVKNNYVGLTSDQTISGVKTFAHIPEIANGAAVLPANADAFEMRPSGVYRKSTPTGPNWPSGHEGIIVESLATDSKGLYRGSMTFWPDDGSSPYFTSMHWETADAGNPSGSWQKWLRFATTVDVAKSGKVQGAVTADGKALTIDSNGNLVLPPTSTTDDIDAALTSYLKTADADKTYAKPADITSAIKAIPAPDLSGYAKKTDIPAAPDLSTLESKADVAADASKALGFNGLVANATESTAQGATSDGKVYLVK